MNTLDDIRDLTEEQIRELSGYELTKAARLIQGYTAFCHPILSEPYQWESPEGEFLSSAHVDLPNPVYVDAHTMRLFRWASDEFGQPELFRYGYINGVYQDTPDWFAWFGSTYQMSHRQFVAGATIGEAVSRAALLAWWKRDRTGTGE